MSLLEMKLIKTDFVPKARFRVALMLFLIMSGGLSLPQHMKVKIRTKSQEVADAYDNPTSSQLLSISDSQPLDLMDTPVKSMTVQLDFPGSQMHSRVKRKIGGIGLESEHRRNSVIEPENYKYPGSSQLEKVKMRSRILFPDSVSNRGKEESGAFDLNDQSRHQPHHHNHLDRQQRAVLRQGSEHRSDQDVRSERSPIDSILNDVHIDRGSSDNIIDYYFVDDALLREDEQHHVRHGSSVRHGVIINLTGLIPNGKEEPEDEPDSDRTAIVGIQHEDDHDEILAFKAFEIRPSLSEAEAVGLASAMADPDDPLVVDESPGGVSADYYADHRASPSDNRRLAGHSRSFSSHNKEEDDDETPVEPALSENRNLSRKRRQKALPSSEDGDRHRRHHFGRRRRRKRKRRHRNPARQSDENSHSRAAEVVPEALPTMTGHRRHQQERFLLKSNSPAYVITSASEVKKDWCKTVPFKQKVVEKNCKARFITNNFCYGQCNSFFIPHVGRGATSGAIPAAFQSCALCKPHKYKWTTVTLSCPKQEQQRVEKRVLIVESCRCKTETLQ